LIEFSVSLRRLLIASLRLLWARVDIVVVIVCCKLQQYCNQRIAKLHLTWLSTEGLEMTLNFRFVDVS
jgi:hypothetical protein